jgi:ectoine hydroxylase-related dioxygenase (phytanoyl-CoA dioxygenase family)
METAEMSRSIGHSKGQEWHMDSVGDDAACVVNVPSKEGVHAPSTSVKKYAWQGYPDNISADSTVPEDWNAIPEERIPWLPGDILFFQQSLIHRAPPNPSEFDRHVFYMGGSVGGHKEHFSDTLVVTNRVFRALRR